MCLWNTYEPYIGFLSAFYSKWDCIDYWGWGQAHICVQSMWQTRGVQGHATPGNFDFGPGTVFAQTIYCIIKFTCMWNRILSGRANQSQGRANALFLENVLSRCLVGVYPVPSSLFVCPLTCLSTRASRQTWSGFLDFAACPFALPMTPNQSKTKWKTSTTSWLRPPPLSRHFLSSWETSGIR